MLLAKKGETSKTLSKNLEKMYDVANNLNSIEKWDF